LRSLATSLLERQQATRCHDSQSSNLHSCHSPTIRSSACRYGVASTPAINTTTTSTSAISQCATTSPSPLRPITAPASEGAAAGSGSSSPLQRSITAQPQEANPPAPNYAGYDSISKVVVASHSPIPSGRSKQAPRPREATAAADRAKPRNRAKETFFLCSSSIPPPEAPSPDHGCQ
jgi:hypothetical protein